MDTKVDRDILYFDTAIQKNNVLQTNLETSLHITCFKHREYPCLLLVRAALTVEAAFCGTIFFLALFSLLYLFRILTGLEEDLRILDTAVTEYECFETRLSSVKGLTEGTWIRWNEEEELCFIKSQTKIPFLGNRFFSVKTYQQLRFRTYEGKSMIPEEDSSADYVYVAEHGTVYHRNSSCVYLNPKISQIPFGSIESSRNRSGAKYYACLRCGKKKKHGAYVYITPYGDSWHTEKNCPGLKRNIRKLPRSDAANLAACSKCGRFKD